LNPRLNLDFNLLKNYGFVKSLDLSAGTGLFSAMNTNVFVAEKQFDIEEMKPNRSWTSVLGTKLELPESLSFNIEGYYKHIWDRLYVPIYLEPGSYYAKPYFNGEGRVWGIDLMLQKAQSRYWDGWLSYSYNWARYRDPEVEQDGKRPGMGISGGTRGDDWYFPSYHRFHNLNLVLNIKPVPRINIYTRFGIASGVQILRRTGKSPESYPIYIYDPDSNDSKFIELYRWPSERDENKRTTPSLPLDIKFSILGNNKTGKSQYELYVAVENALSLLYSAQGNTSYNQYTGKEDKGNTTASYEIPIPIPSFGFKISY
jgi:hypothetical protein